MEVATERMARAMDVFSSVPEHARQAMRVGAPMPGVDADPVFIIPGLTADRWMYRRGKEMLEAEGFMVGGMQMPWHGWGGIPSDARKVRSGIEQLLEQAQHAGRDVDRVQIVGDSEGGLIGRQFLQFEEGADLVSRYVSNGTPHGAIRPLNSEAFAQAVQRLKVVPPGVRDLLTSSPVMRELNADWGSFLARTRAKDPDFHAHAIASRLSGRDTDGLVPVSSARLRGDADAVTNYLTDGAHSINLAFGRRQTEAGSVLLRVLGSNEPEAQEAARNARAAAQAWAGAHALG